MTTIETKQIYAYVGGAFGGNYDVGVLKLEGFTLISDGDLEMLKQGLPPPVEAGITAKQAKRLRALIAEAIKATDFAARIDLKTSRRNVSNTATKRADKAMKAYIAQLVKE